jgi:hypothetical protein
LFFAGDVRSQALVITRQFSFGFANIPSLALETLSPYPTVPPPTPPHQRLPHSLDQQQARAALPDAATRHADHTAETDAAPLVANQKPQELVQQIIIHIQRLLLFPMGTYLLSVELIAFCYMGSGPKPFPAGRGCPRTPEGAGRYPIDDGNTDLAGAPVSLKFSKPLLHDTSECSQAAASTLD